MSWNTSASGGGGHEWNSNPPVEPSVGAGAGGWDATPAAAGTFDDAEEAGTTYGGANGNFNGGGDFNAGGDEGPRGCFRCGEEGHSKADCPNPAKPRPCYNCGQEGHTKAECTAPGIPRPCFNCGQEGHNKADCTNEAIPRQFTGMCRICEQQGHRASDCPSKPPTICRNCAQEGHEAVECKNRRKMSRDDVEDVPAEEAWNKILAAVKDHDLDDVKAAAQQYFKAVPDVTYQELESAFRKQNIGIYLIGIKKDLAVTLTNVDLQGNLDKEYSIQWRWSPNSRSPKEKEIWPATPEENLERLADAGEVQDRGIPKCSNCDELGHIAKKCPQDKVEKEQVVVKCYNCEGVGHRVRDCPNPRPDRFACRNCKQSGHTSKECPEPRSAEGVECKKCNEMGHFSRDCPQGGGGGGACHNCGQEGHRKQDCTNERVLQCRNCDAFGHLSKECPEKKDWSRVKCSVCSEMGHTKVRCPQNRAEAENSGGGESGGYGGDSGAYGNGGGDDYGASAAGGGENAWGGNTAAAPVEEAEENSAW